MKQSKVIVSGVFWTIFQNVISILYGIVSVPFLINYFGKEEYGLIGLALSVNVYIQLLDMGMTNSNVKFFSEFIEKGEEEKVQRLFSLTHLFYLAIGILNSIVLFGISFFVSDLFLVDESQAVILRNLLWILALNATFSWLSICFDQFLRAHELVDWIKKRSAFLKLLQFGILAVTILFKLSIELYFFAYTFIVTAILPWTLLKAKKVDLHLKINFRFNKEMFLHIIPYALSVFSFSIFQFLAINFRPLFLGNMSGPAAVAEFNVMSTIAMVVTVLSGSFMQVLLPIVTKMSVKSDKSGIDTIMYDGTKYVNLLLSAVVFCLILCVNEVFTVYVGSEYTSLSKWMVVWLLTLLLGHRNVMTSLVFTESKLKSVAIMGAIAMSFAITCYIIFTPKYGVGGVVIGFAVHELIHTLFYYSYFIPRKFNISTWKILIRTIMPSWLLLGIAVGILYVLFAYFECSTWMSLVLKCISFGIAFFLISLILLNDRDKKVIKSVLNRK